MALIDGKKFSKIIEKYCCDSKVFGDVRKHILDNYCLNDDLQSGGCLIIIINKSGRRFFLQKKYRCFDLKFSFCGIPEDLPIGRKSYIHLTYEGAEEISFREFKKRAITQPAKEMLSEAKRIINPIVTYQKGL